MADIYSQARQVIAWLGLETMVSRTAFEFLRDAELSCPRDCERLKDGMTRDALLYLSEREYWNRVWIAQEIGLHQESRLSAAKFKFLGSSSLTSAKHARMSGQNASQMENGHLCGVFPYVLISRGKPGRGMNALLPFMDLD